MDAALELATQLTTLDLRDAQAPRPWGVLWTPQRSWVELRWYQLLVSDNVRNLWEC